MPVVSRGSAKVMLELRLYIFIYAGGGSGYTGGRFNPTGGISFLPPFFRRKRLILTYLCHPFYKKTVPDQNGCLKS